MARPSCREIYRRLRAWYYTPTAQKQAVKDITELGIGNLPICMAKTQYSFSDNADAAGRVPGASPSRCAIVRLSAGAGFLVALTGDIMTMPGLPKVPAAEQGGRRRERPESPGLF